MITTVEDRLTKLANHIDAALDATPELSVTDAAPVRPRAGRRRAGVVAALAVVIVAAGALGALFTHRASSPPEESSSAQGTNTGRSDSTPPIAPPVSLPAGTSAPGELVPHVADPPAWLGELRPGRRLGAQRTGTWTTMAIARPAAVGYDTPIAVSAVDGSWSVLDDATDVIVDGRLFRQARAGGVEVLATTTTPMLVASGAVSQTLLADVLVRTDTAIVDGGPALGLDDPPDGYVEIVPPTRLAEDPSVRRTLANTSGEIGLSEVSDLVDPLLAAAMTGSDLRPAAFGELTGWTGTSVAHTTKARFVIWSPQGGVVVEVDVEDDALHIDRMTGLAAEVTVLPVQQWDAAHSE